MHLHRSFIALLMLATFSNPILGEEKSEAAKDKLESPSPDGQFAFRFGKADDGETQTYDLVERKSGKFLAHVCESDPNFGASGRFLVEVLWRPDSKAFALTATLWKRGSEVFVYRRNGATFREIKLPELDAEITDKAMAGKEYPHVNQINSQSAQRWQKDDALTVKIESIQDGNEGTITASRTVILGFGRSSKAKILKSTLKFVTEKQ